MKRSEVKSWYLMTMVLRVLGTECLSTRNNNIIHIDSPSTPSCLLAAELSETSKGANGSWMSAG